jgi:hypothetical protein
MGAADCGEYRQAAGSMSAFWGKADIRRKRVNIRF